jgi:hypothetical protein
MGKKLKKPKLKKLKVRKLRGGGMDMGNAANQAQSAAMGGGDGSVQRDTGLEKQRQVNITAQENKASISPMAVASNVLTVAGMFTNPLVAAAKYGYSQFKKGQQNKMDYEGQAAGVTPMSSPKTTYATNTGVGNDSPTKTVANTVAPKPLFQNVTPSNVAASNFMVRPGVRLAPLNVANMPKASSQGFMLKPGVALSDVSKASSGKLIKGKPKLAKKGWK